MREQCAVFSVHSHFTTHHKLISSSKISKKSIMLLADKYRPLSLDKIDCHPNLAKNLKNLVSNLSFFDVNLQTSFVNKFILLS